jgi:hypothetical protein
MTLLIIGILLCAATSFGGNKMAELYNINEAVTFRPEEYSVRGSSLALFPVPQDNSVGTNDMGNAITLLTFKKGRLISDKYFRNAADDFEGGGTYLPVIDKDTIGFAQMRRFLLFDFKSKYCRDYLIVMSLEKSIEKIAIADSRQKHFIFEIQAHNPGSEDPWDYTNHLLLMDLSGPEQKMIKEMNIGKATVWTTAFGKNFLYDVKSEKMRVLDLNFEDSNHPLAEILTQNKDEITFTWIHAHPYLPFAMLSGGYKGSTLISWRADKETTPLHLFSRATQFSFSPDGKWLVFRKKLSTDSEATYLMPVSEKYPNYLGSPILLANDYFDSGHFAWTTNPVSFVGSSLDKLYRWDLTNDAHPESDKPTFHDYIVGKDLEILTREKKQGLGEKPE